MISSITSERPRPGDPPAELLTEATERDASAQQQSSDELNNNLKGENGLVKLP